jgi:hypothetical protein
MTLTRLTDAIQGLPVSVAIGESALFGVFEAVHMVGVAVLFGSLFMVDLRLLGLAAQRYGVQAMTQELTPWTWAGFCIAAVTGMLMAITNLTDYAANPAFRLKMLLLVLALANMLAFEAGAGRNAASWGEGKAIPLAARIAGGLSLGIWIGVICAGRWIAFAG